MPDPIHTGKVSKVTSNPQGFEITVTGPPEVIYTYLCDDPIQWSIVVACYTKGSDCTVDGPHGGPPNSVTGK